jgi:hypothetical protein
MEEAPDPQREYYHRSGSVGNNMRKIAAAPMD